MHRVFGRLYGRSIQHSCEAKHTDLPFQHKHHRKTIGSDFTNVVGEDKVRARLYLLANVVLSLASTALLVQV